MSSAEQLHSLLDYGPVSTEPAARALNTPFSSLVRLVSFGRRPIPFVKLCRRFLPSSVQPFCDCEHRASRDLGRGEEELERDGQTAWPINRER